MCKDFAELIIGLDPMIFEKVWNKLHRSTFWGIGGGGVIFSGISAIDIALWDIKGKALGVPVYQLLGGKTNDKLRAYASQIQFDWGKECHALSKPEQYCDAARKAIADGYNCIKVDPVGFDLQGRWMGWSNYGILEYDQLKIAVDRVAAIREAGGPALDIIIELHSLTDKKTAIQLGRELEKFRCFNMRSRRTPQPDPIREIADNVKIPMATGEGLLPLGLPRILRTGSVASSSPISATRAASPKARKSATWLMSMTSASRSHLRRPEFHGRGAQVERSSPTSSSTNTTKPPFSTRTSISASTIIAVNGYFSVPERPGIGNELTDETIAASEVVTIKANRWA